MPNATIKDVAKLAAVSTATVSHVINNAYLVTPETKHKVQAAIDALSYKPNVHARNLASGRSRTLALIISDISDPFFAELAKPLYHRALQLGHEVITANTNPSYRLRCIEHFLQMRVCGIMDMSAEKDGPAIRLLCESDVPCVFLDSGQVGPQITNICVDYQQGIHHAIEHLFNLGHRRITFICGNRGVARDRRQAFMKVMEDRRLSGLATVSVFDGDYTFQAGRGEISKLFELCPTAIIAANDTVAAGALRALKCAGMRIPGDVSVIGCDDTLIASLTDPSLTTVVIPRDQIGRVAVDAVLANRFSQPLLSREIKIPTRLIVRESTGPPSESQAASGTATSVMSMQARTVQR